MGFEGMLRGVHCTHSLQGFEPHGHICILPRKPTPSNDHSRGAGGFCGRLYILVLHSIRQVHGGARAAKDA